MRYYIKSKKTGRVKTLLFFDIHLDNYGKYLTSNFDTKTEIGFKHLLMLLEMVDNHVLNSANFGKKRIDINENTYAVLKQTNSTEENETLANNANLWRKVYEKNRNFKCSQFTSKEKQILKKQNWKPDLVQAWFDCDEWFAKTKTVIQFDKYISEVLDWLNAKKQGLTEVEKNNYPAFYSVKFKNSLPAQDISKYLIYLRSIGYKPVYSTNNKSQIIDWKK